MFSYLKMKYVYKRTNAMYNQYVMFKYIVTPQANIDRKANRKLNKKLESTSNKKVSKLQGQNS